MTAELDVGEIEAGLAQQFFGALHGGAGRVVRGGGEFVGGQHPSVAAGGDEVGEGSADVDADTRQVARASSRAEKDGEFSHSRSSPGRVWFAHSWVR